MPIFQENRLRAVFFFLGLETREETEDGKNCTICGIAANDKASAPMYSTGDINDDGSVVALDIIACVESATGHLLAPDAYPGDPDINTDGSVTALDVIRIVDITD